MRVPANQSNTRLGDPAVLVGDGSKAANLLGWQPKIVGLHDISRTHGNGSGGSRSCRFELEKITLG